MRQLDSVVIIANLRFTNPVDGDVLEALDKLVAATRAEAGCLEYHPHVKPDDPCALVFYEHWKDQAAVEAHFATLHLAEFRQWAGPRLEGGGSDVGFWRRLA